MCVCVCVCVNGISKQCSVKLQTFLVIMHPVEHDFWCPPVAGGDIASHDLCCCSSQPKVKQFNLTVLTHTNVAGLQVL